MTTLTKTKRTDIASNRICVMGEFDSSVFLHAHCSCGHENHQQTLEIEVEDGDINLLIYSKIVTPYVHEPSYNASWLEKAEYFYKDWRDRVRWAASALFKGYVEAENVFSLSGSKQVDDYIDTLSRAKNHLWLEQERQKAKKSVRIAENEVECTHESTGEDGC